MTKVFYIGDSTVQLNRFDTYPQTGMSQVLELFLAPDVQVMPHGKNGRSTKSFLDEGRFVPVQEQMGQGDFLLIQSGHNDEKADPARHTEPFGSYQENLRFFIREARARGAYPVLWAFQQFTAVGPEAVGMTMMISNVCTGLTAIIVAIPVIQRIRKQIREEQAAQE